MAESATPSAAVDPGPGQIRRIAWLHFVNDLSLDFLTPLLPTGVGVAWLGVMEGLADGIGQALKIITGRASDRSGRRARWVTSGYLVNALARPLSAVGLALAWPVWIVVCRVADRVGKGVRGSATDALVTDWSTGHARTLAFARIRTFDHLGSTCGGLTAALAAYALPPRLLWCAVSALVVITAWVTVLASGLRDRDQPPAAHPAASGWWPSSPALRLPLLAMAIAALATKISPLIILVQVTGQVYGADAAGSRGPWPLWQACLGWAALGLVQAGAAAWSGPASVRLGPARMLGFSWLAAAGVFSGLATVHGSALIAVGAAFGLLTGLTEGVEKAWLAEHSPAQERARAFGALALVTAIAGLLGNGLCGILLVHWGRATFWCIAGAAVLACLLSFWPRPAVPATVTDS